MWANLRDWACNTHSCLWKFATWGFVRRGLTVSKIVLICLCVCVPSRFGRVWLLMTPWTVARHAPLSLGFSRQDYWSGLPCPSPVDLPDLGIKPASPTLAGDLPPVTTGRTLICLGWVKPVTRLAVHPQAFDEMLLTCHVSAKPWTPHAQSTFIPMSEAVPSLWPGSQLYSQWCTRASSHWLMRSDC